MEVPSVSNTATRQTASSSAVTLLGFPADESQFPQGQCRYILTLPEVRGHRCGCVNFSHNKAVPGVICECGHLACYHMSSPNALSPEKNHGDIETLRERVQILEQHINPTGAEQETIGQTVYRVTMLEDLVEKNHEETRNDIKASYRHMSAAWHLVEQLQKRLHACEQKQREQTGLLESHAGIIQELRDRNMELLEGDEMLEERIEQLQNAISLAAPSNNAGAMSTRPATVLAKESPNAMHRRRLSAADSKSAALVPGPLFTPPSDKVEDVKMLTSPSSPSLVWTLHVSILPSREQPFPFEKDTAAYKRCLSRGLQRPVAVADSSAEAISAAISRAFRHVFQGCQWEPLEAKVCDARKLEGLPMLRPLENDIECDMTFIREHCAVCDGRGRIQSMYVALKTGKLSWKMIRSLPITVDGLESSWAFDGLLDQDEEKDENKVQGDGVLQSSSLVSQAASLKASLSLKRSAEVEAAGSTAETSGRIESDGPRTKVARTCAPDVQVEPRIGMEATL